MMLTCMQKKVKRSPTPLRKVCGSPARKEGEYQVQNSPEHQGDHLHAEKGRDKVQHNTEHNGDYLHE